jgi:hypothetical protein
MNRREVFELALVVATGGLALPFLPEPKPPQHTDYDAKIRYYADRVREYRDATANLSGGTT